MPKRPSREWEKRAFMSNLDDVMVKELIQHTYTCKECFDKMAEVSKHMKEQRQEELRKKYGDKYLDEVEAFAVEQFRKQIGT